jgi:predicted amidohydrolase YtcJ
LQPATDVQALASMLDDLDTSSRSIFVEATDLHSTWCNTAALKEMGVTISTEIPGGGILRDQNGEPSGLLQEAAHLGIVVPHLDNVLTTEKKIAALESAIEAYIAAGYTGAVDMAMDEHTWEILTLVRAKHQGNLPLHLAVHWLVPWSGNQSLDNEYVDGAVALHKRFDRFKSRNFYIAGIKLILDGVVDGCTAALSQPYANLTSPVDLVWGFDDMVEIIQRAEIGELKCALHAIGDAAITEAINAISVVGSTQDSAERAGRRHRIEHLELTTPEDARRLGALGITASVQPVHSDPVLFQAWPKLLGTHRCGRAFAYREFLDGGATLAFGTDAPTAAHLPLPNLYHATTRRSTIDPESRETVNENFSVTLVQATVAATMGAAYSTFAETWTGKLAAGMTANFAVIDIDSWSANDLPEARVVQTWYEGQKVFDVTQS